MNLRDSLRTAYDRAADLREASTLQPWKIEERERYLELLRAEGASSLLEVGAGTGVMGRWFADQGLRIIATDLSPVMVDHCRAKGLEAYEMEFLTLKFEQLFDAVFGMNCLLHIPRNELAASLIAIRGCLKPGGVAYLGMYGGIDREGTWAGDDNYEPKRFFSYSTDEAIQAAMSAVFKVIDFRTMAPERDAETHYQALTLRRPY